MADSAAESISTSPRKLQEMTLPANDGHDVTSASGVSMKQSKEQLNGLRKEHAYLKLRISILEEKLGTGVSQAVQDLLEQNVRLQVEVEELRRQLTDKEEFIAAITEVIYLLEHQESISTATRKEADEPLATHNKVDGNNTYAVEETYQSESAGDHLAGTVDNEDSDKEVTYSQVKKYEEIIKCKDEHIKNLENKVRQLLTPVDNTNEDSTGCVPGEEKKKLAESVLEQSLVLSVGLELDESMAPEESTMDESNLDILQSMNNESIDELTKRFGHHLISCDDCYIYPMRKPIRNIPQADVISESEPDRNVSLATVDLCDTGVSVPECVVENNEMKATLALEQHNAIETNKNLESQTVLAVDTRIKDSKKEVSHHLQLLERLHPENHGMESTFLETERSLRPAADKAAASLAAFKVALALYDRLSIELEKAQEKVTYVIEGFNKLEITSKVAMEDNDDKIDEIYEGVPFDEARPTSPDQGIDRLSSLEQNDEVNLSPRSMCDYQKVTLRRPKPKRQRSDS